MRVTGNAFTNYFVDQANKLEARQYQLQNQAATGQRIQAPEDDPVAMQRTLDLQSENRSLLQYSNNISTLQDRATSSYTALQAVKKVSDRAGEIATLSGGMRSPEELKAYATEVTQMIQSAVQAMNSKSGDQYLFGGTATAQPPFVVATDADGNVTGVTYQGNTSVAQNEIGAAAMISVDVPGANNSGSGPRGLIADSRTGADFFSHLISLQNHLLAGDTAAISSTDAPALSKDEDNILYHVTNNGLTQTRLETAATAASAGSQSVQTMISNEAGADLTQTLTQLSQAQTSYQAALQSASGILKTSLLNYL
jgi:flagellar hook-associated protein 3 FlgL